MANLHSRRIAGSLAYWDAHPKRLIGAVGLNVHEFFDDFIFSGVASDAITGWSVTLVEAGGGESTITQPDGAGGKLLLTTDANENDGVQMQVTGESFGPVNTPSALYFGIRFQADEATQNDIFAGLSITDTTVLATQPTDSIHLDKLDGVTAITGHINKNSTATDSASTATMAAATNTIWEWYYDGLLTTPTVEFFVDGVSLGIVSGANLVDDELLTPTIAILAGSAAVRTMTVDWLRVIEIP